MNELRLPLPPYCLLRDFLDAETRAALLEFSLGHEAKFRPALIGGVTHDPSFRVSVEMRDFEPVETALRRCIGARTGEITAGLQHAPFACTELELQLVAHGDGAFYRRHLDTSRQTYEAGKSTRMISAVYYFHTEPKAFSGGAFRLWRFSGGESEGDYVDIAPEQNMLLAFPSWAPHEVMPVSCPSGRFSASRFAVNCWFYG